MQSCGRKSHGKRVKDGVEPIKRPTGMGPGGSRPQPPKAVARRASLGATRSMSNHQTAKRRLTDKTVAFVVGRLGSCGLDLVSGQREHDRRWPMELDFIPRAVRVDGHHHAT